jgi:hypothetical protein
LFDKPKPTVGCSASGRRRIGKDWRKMRKQISNMVPESGLD